MHAPLTEIVLRHGESELARLVLPPGEYIVGRETDAEICAQTPLLSRKHARLTIHDDFLDLEDLGSSNGTFVDDLPITGSTRFFPGQNVRLGDVALEVQRHLPTSAAKVPLSPEWDTIRRILPEELLTHQRYAVGAIVARGGMGAILTAEQSAMKRGVAMKVMLAHPGESDVLRFIEEAQITGQLEHPNIVPVHEIGVDEKAQLFYTMKMVRGITLQKVLTLLAQGVEATVEKYPLAALLTLFQKTCDAMAFAHSKGVIHRDLKPENIMLGDFGEVLVMDWGLAKVVGTDFAESAGPRGESSPGRSLVASLRSGEGSMGSTLMGTIMGTPQYMSPEQARGEIDNLDGRSDIYALGAILFHILYLRPPVRGGEPMQIVRKVAEGQVDWPSAADASKLPHLPGGEPPDSLVAVCRKALTLAPSRRYQSVTDFQLDLTAYQTGFATSAENAGAWKQFRFFIRRNRAVSTAVTAAVLTIAAVTAIFTVNVVHERNRAEATLQQLRGTAPTFADQARALVEAGQLQDALSKISYATQIDPGNPDYLLQRAHYLEVALRLREAITAYRAVLALRPGDAAAQQNIALCERLLAANDGRDELPKVRVIELVNALLAQGRVIEANPLAQSVGQGSATGELALRARLKAVAAQPGWNNGRLRLQPNGTLSLSLNDLRMSDLEPLRGFPISSLFINDPALTDISPLTGMPLINLGLANTGVVDLKPLVGSSVETLILFGTRVKDLSPLRGTKLRELSLGSGELSDLSALRGLPLESLSAYGNRISDLRPLHGMPLRQLSIGNNPVTDFSPLAGMPLEKLDLNNMDLSEVPALPPLPLQSLSLGSNRISDYRPLARYQLKALYLNYNPIGDLRPLAKMPLQILDLATDSRGVDLAPLAACRDLEDVILPRYFLHEEVLRALPNLKRLRIHLSQPVGMPPERFWKELKPEWIAVGHARTILQMSELKGLTSNPVFLDPDGFLFLDLSRVEGSLPSLEGLPVSRMSLDFAKVSDIGALRGLPLRRLSLNNTAITDLTPLQGMSLVALNAAGTRLTDLSALRGMPLQALNLGGVRLRAQDLALLAAMPLQDVILNGSGVTDLSVLRGKPLRRLDMGGTGVSNLAFLDGAPLENLNMGATPISDLSPLRGKPLQSLNIGGSRVNDLSPLRGLPIVDLVTDQIPTTDFSALLDLPKLEKLRVTCPPAQILGLRRHPTLKLISTGPNLPHIGVEEYWAAYDREQARLKK